MTAKSVLFVCVSNAGKSVMAAGLMSQIAAPNVSVTSAVSVRRARPQGCGTPR